jgi:hypothetical protein
MSVLQEPTTGGIALLTRMGDLLPVTSVDGLSCLNVSLRCCGSFSYQSSSSVARVDNCWSERS